MISLTVIRTENSALVLMFVFFLSDQHHFDNPVYAYQCVSKSQPNLLENGNLNNGVTIKNNLSLKDDKNREWEKLGTFTFHDDACSLGNYSKNFQFMSSSWTADV